MVWPQPFGKLREGSHLQRYTRVVPARVGPCSAGFRTSQNARSTEALARAVALFEDMKRRPLRPVNEIGRDTVRHELDTRLTTEVLGFPPELAAPDGSLALLRQKLALEPSIAGGKSV